MSQSDTPECPFKIGDVVKFVPSERTLGHYHDISRFGIMPGSEYQIKGIEAGIYLYFDAGGGWPWNEFELVRRSGGSD